MSGARFDARFAPLDALIRDRAGWADLARAALEPNPFYEPDFLLASIRHLEPAGAVRLLVVRDHEHDNRLAGLFPLGKPRWRDGILVYRDEPLASVIEDVSRYSDRKIEAQDATLVALRYSATHREPFTPLVSALLHEARILAEQGME